MSDFIKERNEALLSLDEEKIDEYIKKHDPFCKKPKDKKIYWAGIHKAICNLFFVESNGITLEEYERSYKWLQDNGFNPMIDICPTCSNMDIKKEDKYCKICGRKLKEE